MLIAIHEMKRYAHCYSWSEAICSLLNKEGSFMLIAIHEMKRHAHCYSWSEAICSMPYKE